MRRTCADTVADRDPGVGDLGGGGAAHLAHALLQGVHAVQAWSVYRRGPPPLVLSGSLPPGAVLRSPMKRPADAVSMEHMGQKQAGRTPADDDSHLRSRRHLHVR
jgi:hypothetical protein